MRLVQPGQSILHYKILEKIGEGGMGEVYKAEDTKLGRQIALKILPSDTQEEQKAKRRLLQEARAASALNHPNIVTIHNIEDAEGFVFIVMEYVEGKTLKSLIEAGPLETSQLISIASQVADGLAAAHSAGLIHRDIKPSNILVTPQGQAKILDFGLAKLTQVSDQPLSSEQTMSRLTRTGMILGTVSYMSPEQTRGETLDARTDLFSFGCVLYEAATGKVPFSGPSILSVLHEIATVEPPAPSTAGMNIPRGLDFIIQKALAKNKDQRYSSASEMAAALRGLTFANRYQIIRELGRGGMGVVNLAHDPLLERDVAIKVISPEHLSPDAVERFKREARVVAKMDHRSIVSIYDIGEHEGSLFFIMPYVSGTSLRAFLKDGSLNMGEVLDIGIQTAEALEYSHARGVVHRDIKPENIMVAREPEGIRVRVTDFGLAMATTENRLTRTGSFVGTIAYLSPEQLAAKTIDHRSDIYALGIVLYECLTGQPPFTGEVQSVLYRIAHENPDSPRLRGADVREELEAIVLQCLEKDPARRPQRAKEVADALTRYRSRLQESDREQKLSMIHKPSMVAQRPPASPFVGREKEFGELQRRMSTASLQGELQFAVVGGDVGIGKSRLLEELERIARAKNIRVLHSRFLEMDQSLPYQGFCEVIQEYFHQKVTPSSQSGPVDFTDLASDLVALFPVLAEISEITGGQKITVSGEGRKIQDRTYIYDLLARAFLRIGGGKPLVLFFEDLHNADISLDALQYVVRRLGPTPTFIVGTYRTADLDKQHPLTRMLNNFKGDKRFVSILLEPFSEQEHKTLLQTLVGSENLEETFVHQLYDATEGNPHFTKELVRSLIDSGKVVQTTTGSWNLSGEAALSSEALPPTIQETVGKRIERLPQESREILSVASVLGKTFDFRDLEFLLGEKGNMEDSVDGLISSGFIEEERAARADLLTFSSAVVRDVLYAQIPRRKRRSLHRKYAEELERRNAGRLDRIYPILVHHYQEGDVADKVIEFGMELAKRSLEALSPDDALRSARTVLDFVQEDEGQASALEGEVRLLLAEAYRLRGNPDTALQELEQATTVFESRKDSSRLLAAVVLAAETAWEGRKVDEAKRWVEKGLGLASSLQQTDSLAKLLSLAATVANMRGEYDRARQYLEQAERLRPAVKEKEEAIPVGGRLTVGLASPVQDMHPVSAGIIEETEIIGNVFETLLRIDEQGHLIPGLCEEWKVSEQGKSFAFKLRPNVLLHDGEPLTAECAKSCFEQSIQIGKARLPEAFAAIRGVQEFLEGTEDHVIGIQVQAANELKIELQEPLSIYPALLTDSHASIARQRSEQAEAIGTGPFKMISCTPTSVVLQRNDQYWKGEVPLDGVDFRCGVGVAELAAGIKSGQLDLASNLLPQDLDSILQDPQFRSGIVEATKKNIYFVLFHDKSKFSKIPQLRQALCGILRIDDLVRGTLGRFAQPAVGLLPPGILGHDPGKRQHQIVGVEKANQLLQSSGVSFPLKLNAAVHPVFQDRYSAIFQALIKAWAEIGVELTIGTPTMKSYLESNRNAEGFDLRIGRYNADYEDPDNFTYFLFHSKAGLYDSINSEELDRLMEEARVENDPHQRERMYRRIENQLIESSYLLPLFQDIDYRVASPKVRGLKLYSSPPYIKYAELGRGETTAPSVTRKTGGGIIYVPLGSTIESMDPSLTINVQQADVLPAVFETLTRQAGGARIEPWLASEIHAEEGGRRFSFRLRSDVRFHNGRRMTSRDVRYSFERLLANEESQARWFFSSIRGAENVINGKTSELEGIRIRSASEFSIDLVQPLSFFPAIIAYPAAAIVPEGTERIGGNWRDGCIGTGPFRATRFEPNRRLELEANPDYWRPTHPKSDGMVFSFGVAPQEILSGFRAGRYLLAGDLFPSDVEALRHEPEYASRYRETPRLSTYFVVFNVHRGPLADEKLRHMLVQSLDVESAVRKNIGRLAIPAHGILPPGLLGYEPVRRGTMRPITQERSGEKIELTGTSHSIFDGAYAPLAKEVLSGFQTKGFRPRMEGAKAETVQIPHLAESLDFVLLRWIGDYPDADTFFHGLLHSERGYIGSFCGIPEMDELIEKGRTETRPQLRHEIYQEAEKMIVERALLLPLFHEQTYRFARPEVQDFEVVFSIQAVPYENLSLRK